MSANIAEPLAHHARAYAHKPVMVDGGRLVTYGELDRQVSQTAAHLLERWAWRRATPSASRSPGQRRAHRRHVLGAGARRYRDAAARLAVDRGGAGPRGAVHFGAKFVLVEPDGQRLASTPMVGVDDAWRRRRRPCTADRAFSPRARAIAAVPVLAVPRGGPKGPRISHGQFLARYRVHWINLGFNSQDRYLSATPFYYGGGRTFAMSRLYSGGTVFLLPPPTSRKSCARRSRSTASAPSSWCRR